MINPKKIQAEDKTKDVNSGTGSSVLPSLSLPKGGGAVRGMGEKFSANPVTGTGSMSVPIFTSPGRSGFGPQLSLSYDSGSGNGPFGLGWSLSLPSITRKTDKGLPRYQDADESDTFILSGAEDLVPVLIPGDGDGEWRQDSFESEDGNFAIRRYRPRVEGLFARIERWTNRETGDVHWRSISKDNITTLYGNTANSRIAKPGDDPTDRSTIFSWLVCESHDDKGNAIFYEYERENSDNIDTSRVHEKNRSSLIRSANRYLKRILYGNRTPHQTGEDLSNRNDWLFEAVFDYDEGHYEVLPLDAGNRQFVRASKERTRDWPVRQDPFSSYRSGFEVRTYRLCRRVLMFHHFPDELGVDDYLVRSTEFIYHESPIASFITGVIQSGYAHEEDDTYLKKSLPTLEFEYSRLPDIESADEIEIKTIDSKSLENLPYGLDGTDYQWADLDGEGISGILTEQAGAWFYKPNLGGGRFGDLQVLELKPSLADLGGGQQQLMDLAGDGQLDLVEMSRPVAGFFERTLDGDWETWTSFKSSPNIAWNDPNLKFVDLTGDGHADVIVAVDQAFLYYPSLAEEGFGPSTQISKPHDEEIGPRLIFADGTQSVYLADMSGDGLSDIVRILNGEVSYWPNLGYGHFGARVTMDDAPQFERPDQFSQQRIRLADIDGSGVTDIIYLGRDGIYVYFNQSGNSWSRTHKLPYQPQIDNITAVTVIDLLGHGTACLVWSSPLPGDAGRQMKYIDLMAGIKPHLLVSVRNNMGAETRVHYASSTRFYLEDRAAGQPWITRLPFPVHVVEKVEIYDRLSRNRFVTRYTYHHGYFDGIEREFRGFARVDQLDTEEYAALASSDAFPAGDNVDQASHVPPVLRKTWFHTGASLQGKSISHQMMHEYYGAPKKGAEDYESDIEKFEKNLLMDTVPAEDILLADGGRLDWTPSAEEERQACRALKGSMLRHEVYSLDKTPDTDDGSSRSDHPYSVSENNFTIETLQPISGNRHAVFFIHPRESIDYHYERHPIDPRIRHSFTLDVDAFGNVLQSAAVSYGRLNQDPELSEEDRKKQAQVLITCSENEFTNSIDTIDAHRTPLPCEGRTYELTFSPGDLMTSEMGRFDFGDLKQKTKSASPISYEDKPSGGLQKRLIEHARTLYRKDDLSSPLSQRELEPMALPFETYKLALTPKLISSVFGDRVSDAMLLEGGYVHSDGDPSWWIPTGQAFYSPDASHSSDQELAFAREHFFLPLRFRDPFGQVSTVRYEEPYNILVLESEDALHNRVTAGERNANGSIESRNDYRVLQPTLVTDINGNRSEVAFDAHGMVVGTAVMGRQGEDRGDTLDEFEPDLSEDAIIAHIEDPLSDPLSILKGATVRILYDLDRYSKTAQEENPSPNVVYTMVRETHRFESGGENSPVQHSFLYPDGFGREMQKKVQAEPGPVEDGGPEVSFRWVGSGWTIYNNKGQPVKKYEPFFDDTHNYRFAKIEGLSSTLFYDPAERTVATLHPNHTYEKVVFDSWHQTTWDVNDNLLLADPREDPDAGEFFRRLQISEFLPTWHDGRKDGQKGSDEQSAAEKAGGHWATPTRAYFDGLGRTFLTISDNGPGGRYASRVEMDIEGNKRAVIDSNGRIVMRYRYDLLSGNIRQESMDAGRPHDASDEDNPDCGTRWILSDVTGKPVYSWDSRGHRIRQVYDALRRPTHLYVQLGQNSEKLAERTVYGESHPDSHAGTQPGPDLSSLNLRGKVFIQMDSSGISASSDIDPYSGQAEAFDFKGNPLCTVRRFARQYRQRLDWSGIEPLLAADVLDTTALELALQPLLEQERFRTSSTYDALNRPTSVTAPDGTVARPTYNQANLLERLEANLKGEAEVTEFIRDMDYNARGQKVLIEYANNVVTTFDYDDETLRLTRLTTMRGPDPLQDIFYFYDPAGNITSIRDDSLQTIYFDGEIVRPDLDYTYDALYRLVQAKGREHIGQAESPQTSWSDEFRVRLPHPNNGQAMRNYAQSYEYDDVGNFIRFIHHADGGSWVRTYAYEEPSLIEPGKFNNRLSRTTVGQTTENYTYTEHGSMTSMPHLPVMGWDFKDQLEAVDLGSGGTAYYVYDAGGRRVRKVIEQIDGRRREERLYIGSFEIFRRFNGGSGEVDLERETFHLNDDKGRIALVETRTLGEDGSLPRLIRYQMSNHLGSALLELDGSPQAKIVSYEEYYPYGSTSYQAVRSQTDTPKRYRFTGKERDEESGLYYQISRYYAPWLGRWTASDPGGLIDGDNLYRYSRNSPIIFDDPNGMDPPPRTSRYSLGDFPLSAANPLTDPLAHASLFDMAFPGAFGVAFNALDLGNRTRNRVGTGFLNLAEFGITGLLFYGPTVLSHELGHVGGWEDLGVSAEIKEFSWFGGLAGPTSSSTGVTADQRLAISAAGGNQQALNAAATYNRIARFGYYTPQDAWAYFLGQAGTAAYALTTLGNSNPAPSNDINSYSQGPRSWSTEGIAAASTLTALPALAGLIYSGIRFTINNQRNLEVPSLHFGDARLSFPNTQTLLTSSGAVLSASSMLTLGDGGPSFLLGVDVRPTRDFALAVSARTYGLTIPGSRVQVNPHLRLTGAEHPGIFGGLELGFNATPSLTFNFNAEAGINDIRAETERRSEGFSLGAGSIIRF